ncbi:hypothetical protein CP061683_0552B, partial [Chlamydia psittaci 06-1683]
SPTIGNKRPKPPNIDMVIAKFKREGSRFEHVRLGHFSLGV